MPDAARDKNSNIDFTEVMFSAEPETEIGMYSGLSMTISIDFHTSHCQVLDAMLLFYVAVQHLASSLLHGSIPVHLACVGMLSLN